jgi:hypothetical protein
MGDMTKIGGPIVQGSAGVFIGAPTGVACSVCPGGVTSGNPVNPLLGAKVLPGETDIVLPGPLPFILSRSYSSYQTKTPAPVGVFGPGWKASFDIRLNITDETLSSVTAAGAVFILSRCSPGRPPSAAANPCGWPAAERWRCMRVAPCTGCGRPCRRIFV